MAFALRERRRQDEYANYEQQSPSREVNFRQVNYQQDYMQDAYNNYQYSQGYTQAPQQDYQPQMQQPYMGSYSNRASQFVNNGFSATPQQYNYNYTPAQEQYQNDMQYQSYNRNQINQISKMPKARLGKKSVNKDMIKIIVTIMVVATVICGLLIANQFINVKQAQAEEEIPSIDSELLSSVVTDDGSYLQTSIELLPEYEYENSTNWFDKFCDRLGLKLK